VRWAKPDQDDSLGLVRRAVGGGRWHGLDNQEMKLRPLYPRGPPSRQTPHPVHRQGKCRLAGIDATLDARHRRYLDSIAVEETLPCFSATQKGRNQKLHFVRMLVASVLQAPCWSETVALAFALLVMGVPQGAMLKLAGESAKLVACS